MRRTPLTTTPRRQPNGVAYLRSRPAERYIQQRARRPKGTSTGRLTADKTRATTTTRGRVSDRASGSAARTSAVWRRHCCKVRAQSPLALGRAAHAAAARGGEGEDVDPPSARPVNAIT